jgi:hypothetical protein
VLAASWLGRSSPQLGWCEFADCRQTAFHPELFETVGVLAPSVPGATRMLGIISALVESPAPNSGPIEHQCSRNAARNSSRPELVQLAVATQRVDGKAMEQILIE